MDKYPVDKATQDRIMARQDELMGDYRDEHSPDIALLLTLARAVRKYLAVTDMTAPEIAELDRAMKPFEPFPDPVAEE